jgi:hypothetical protein
MALVTKKSHAWEGTMKRIFRFLVMASGILLWGVLLSACGSGKTITVDIPDKIKTLLEKGVPKDTYVFYTLADSQSLTWDKVKRQGLWICGEYPPLIPEDVQSSLIDAGDTLPGFHVRLEEGSFGSESLEVNVMVIVGTTLDECAEETIRIMKNNPGLIMLVERDASFDDKSNLTEVIFK